MNALNGDVCFLGKEDNDDDGKHDCLNLLLIHPD